MLGYKRPNQPNFRNSANLQRIDSISASRRFFDYTLNGRKASRGSAHLSIPSDIKQVFESNSIQYGLQAIDADPHNSRYQSALAKVTILADDHGKIQCILPSNRLLDLETIRSQTARPQLKAASIESLELFKNKLGLKFIPPLPEITGLPTFVDIDLLKVKAVYFSWESDSQLIKLATPEFQRLLGEAEPLSFSKSIIHEDNASYENDKAIFAKAVENFTTLRIKQRLEETLELPPLKETAQQIIKLRVNPNADLDDLASIVETDPSLAAQVVSWAGSPYYAAPGQIRSVHDAIIRVLGFDLVINLALGLALGKSLKVPRSGPQSVTPYWQQAIFTAATLEGLVAIIPKNQRPETGLAYLAGLLHNFGYLVLSHVFPPHFQQICQYIDANPNINYIHIEKHVLGLTRDQMSAVLMRIWNMPEEIYTALRYQHDGDYIGEDFIYPNLIFLATRLLKTRSIGHVADQSIPDQLFQRLGIDPDKANNVIDHVLASASDLEPLAQLFNR